MTIDLKITIALIITGLLSLVLGYLDPALVLLTIGVVLGCAVIGDR
jgi:hypothetical protein